MNSMRWSTLSHTHFPSRRTWTGFCERNFILPLIAVYYSFNFISQLKIYTLKVHQNNDSHHSLFRLYSLTLHSSVTSFFSLTLTYTTSATIMVKSFKSCFFMTCPHHSAGAEKGFALQFDWNRRSPISWNQILLS